MNVVADRDSVVAVSDGEGVTSEPVGQRPYLGGVIVLLLWMFVSSLIVWLGAEFDAVFEGVHGESSMQRRPTGPATARGDSIGRAAA